MRLCNTWLGHGRRTRMRLLAQILFIVGCGATPADAQDIVVQKPQVVDLRNVTRVVFDLSAPGPITLFENVTPGKLYVFFFNNDNTTLTGEHVFLANGSAKGTFRMNTSVLFVGDGPTSVRQVADGVTSR